MLKNTTRLAITSMLILATALLFAVIPGRALAQQMQVTLVTDQKPGGPVVHGLDKITAALQALHIVVKKASSMDEAGTGTVIVAGLSEGSGPAAQLLRSGHHTVPHTAEALSVWKANAGGKPMWVFSGYDDRGLMYALLDAANRISWSKNSRQPLARLEEITEKPAVKDRAISLYTMNRAYWESRMYNKDYWAKYLDMMAENRLNTLVVIFGYENGGFLAPCYPYFFDTEGYPDVKMTGLTAAQQQKNLDAFNGLISMAHARGINFTVGIWDHVYRGGVQGGGLANTKNAPDQPVPGLVWGITEANLVSYTKAALEKFIKLVPGLDAIQFRLHDESGLKKEEQVGFWLDVFKMIKKDYPAMRLDLRAKELPDAVIKGALDIGVNFRVNTKYWMEQMGLPYHPTQINPEKSPRRHSYSDLLRYPQQYNMYWQLWSGGTTRILLWGSPDYVKRFAATTHLYGGEGFEVNEPLATKMEAQPHDTVPFGLLNPAYRYYDYEFERYWHFFQSFGRIAYNPNVNPAIWKEEFAKRFGPAGPSIQNALQEASWILPRIISSCYPYTQFPTTRGWAEKQHMGTLAAYAKADPTDLRQFTTFDEEARLITEKGETPKMLQSANSRWFFNKAASISRQITQAENAAGNGDNKELFSTLTDLKILKGLALYYANRIPAAVYYRLYDHTKNATTLDSAIRYETDAVAAWKQLVQDAGDVYTSDISMGLREADLCGHWKDGLTALEKDLDNLRTEKSGLQNNNPTGPAVPVAIAYRQPSFTVVHQPLTSITPGKPVVITAKVQAPAGVKWVRLKYRSVNQEEEYKTLPMTATAEKGVYRASLPADAVEPSWDFMYFIEMMDNNQAGSIYPDLNIQTPYYMVKVTRP
ncbi:MAG: hypothetical protein INR73_13695 [Williamsia sp.]|nr:hypothetical protein [Williamsia sp.]